MRTSKNFPSPRERVPRNANGFTLVELLAVLAVLGLLSLVIVSGMAGARDGSQTIQCLNNQRQLIVAWQMYAEENSGILVGNFHGGDAQGGAAVNSPNSRNAPWALGWLDYSTRSENTNTMFTVNDRYSRLARYLNHDPKMYQCPADTYVSPAQAALGWTRRSRSYSMSAGVGFGNALSGPWEPIYKQVQNLRAFVNPAPGQTFVFIEEHPDSMNDPLFFLPRATSIVDAPANHHNGGCAVTFADGHSEVHSWEGDAIWGLYARINETIWRYAPIPAGDPDIHWLSFHSPRVRKDSY